MKRYNTIIFDLDGTIADTSEGIYNCIRFVQEKLRLPAITSEQMRSHIGPPMQESYARNFGLSGAQLDEAVSYHKEYALTKGLYEATLYPGIPTLLQSLSDEGCRLAMATLKFEETARKMLDYLKVSSYFHAICGTLSQIKLTKAQLLAKSIERCKSSKSNALLIGDSSYDAIGAHQAGIDFLGVTYGFGFKSKADVDEYPNVGCAERISDILTQINEE
ncbi:MAG: HAD hydrolase-like protein [Bacteroidales bacterium]|nr:HAD hydrolase-like protein [Bacteroidales bacterium]